MEENVNKAIKYMIIASFLFALMGVAAKELSDKLSTIEIVFFRNVLEYFLYYFLYTKVR
ncbi:hypothetical protein MASR2M54_02320 [Aliarcobacter cryaerophilus]